MDWEHENMINLIYVYVLSTSKPWWSGCGGGKDMTGFHISILNIND